jgi:hypothetical protein
LIKLGHTGSMCQICQTGYVSDKEGKCILKEKYLEIGTDKTEAGNCICKVKLFSMVL